MLRRVDARLSPRRTPPGSGSTDPENLMIVTALLWLDGSRRPRGAPHGARRASRRGRTRGSARWCVRGPCRCSRPSRVPDPAFDLARHLGRGRPGGGRRRSRARAPRRARPGAPARAARPAALAAPARRRVTARTRASRRAPCSCGAAPRPRRRRGARPRAPARPCRRGEVPRQPPEPPDRRPRAPRRRCGSPSPYPPPRSACCCCRRSRAPRCAAGSGSPKDAAWAAPRSLARVKAVAAEHGATVNDVLLAAVAGGLRALPRNDMSRSAAARRLRVFVPVDLSAGGARLGNRFGCCRCRCPWP